MAIVFIPMVEIASMALSSTPRLGPGEHGGPELVEAIQRLLAGACPW